MTDKEKIRVEIKRRYKECKGATPATEFQELLDFIDSLQEEPVSEDFDMWYEKEWIPFSHSSYTEKDILEEAYKAGAKWQKRHMIEKAVKWIEEINNHHHIVRYSDSCEPTLNELIEWFDDFMEDEQ